MQGMKMVTVFILLNRSWIIERKQKWQVQVKWDECEITWKPLYDMRLADMVTLARFAHDIDLANTPG